MSKDEYMCKKCGYTKCCCQCPDVNNSSGMVGSEADLFSDESRALAKEVAKKLWDEKKISYKWDQVKDEEFLAFVIEHKRMP